MNRVNKTVFAVATLAACALVAGCGGGPELAEVYGTVTLDGEPLPSAKVRFQPEEGGAPARAITDENGYYHLEYASHQEGALLGKHRVFVNTADEKRENGRAIIIPERVPDEYSKEGKVYEVKPGDNEINIDITGAIE